MLAVPLILLTNLVPTRRCGSVVSTRLSMAELLQDYEMFAACDSDSLSSDALVPQFFDFVRCA